MHTVAATRMTFVAEVSVWNDKPYPKRFALHPVRPVILCQTPRARSQLFFTLLFTLLKDVIRMARSVRYDRKSRSGALIEGTLSQSGPFLSPRLISSMGLSPLTILP